MKASIVNVMTGFANTDKKDISPKYPTILGI